MQSTCPRVVVGGQLVVGVVQQHVRDVQQGGQDVSMETVRDHDAACVIRDQRTCTIKQVENTKKKNDGRDCGRPE